MPIKGKSKLKHAHKIFGLFFLYFNCSMHAREYLYPVGSAMRNGAQYLYLIHQISLKQLQLLELNTESHEIAPALPKHCSPAGLKMLPDNKGYSFIDQGSLYVKFFSKRSPQKIDISEPLYHIEMVEWIDDHTCYFAAKQAEQSNIYQLSLDGKLDCVLRVEGADCLYPQKVGSDLFYIERSFDKKKYTIKCVPYFDLPNPSTSFDTFLLTQKHFRLRQGYVGHAGRAESDKRSRVQDSTGSRIILNTGSQPIAFLRMLNPTQGFYVSYPESLPILDGMPSCLTLSYYEISYDASVDCWNARKLFDFSIPPDLILPDSEDRLFESLLRLLPEHIGHEIIFCSCSTVNTYESLIPMNKNLGGAWYEPEAVKLYRYDFTLDKTVLLIQNETQDLFSPYNLKNAVCYGSSLQGSSKHKPLLPNMWINEGGQVCYNPNLISI